MSREVAEERLKELEQFSGLENDLIELHGRVRSEFVAWRDEIEGTSDRQTKEALLRDYEQMTQRLHKSLLLAKNFARQKAAQMNREELLALAKQRTTKPLSQEDMIGQEVTSSLKRMLETMRTEVDRSSKNISTAKSSSTAITGTATNYRKIDTRLDDTRGLMRDLKKKDRGDKLFVLGALGVLLATVAFILFQRSPEMVKLPVRIAYTQIKYQVINFVGLERKDPMEREEIVENVLSEALMSESSNEDSATESEKRPVEVKTEPVANEAIETNAPKQESAQFNEAFPTPKDLPIYEDLLLSAQVVPSERSTASTAESTFVTFAEYEAERPLFEDQQILIEIKPEQKTSEESETVQIVEAQKDEAASTEPLVPETSMAADIAVTSVDVETTLEEVTSESSLAEAAVVPETFESAVSEAAPVENVVSEATLIAEATPVESVVSEATHIAEATLVSETAPIESSVSGTVATIVAADSSESLPEEESIVDPIPKAEEETPSSNVVIETTIQIDHPPATIASSPEPSQTESSKSSVPTVQTSDVESDVEDLSPSSQLNVDESSYESDYSSEF